MSQATLRTATTLAKPTQLLASGDPLAVASRKHATSSKAQSRTCLERNICATFAQQHKVSHDFLQHLTRISNGPAIEPRSPCLTADGPGCVR